MNRHQDYELRQYQSLPLHSKIVMTKQRIRQWYDYWDGNVYVSFSGGKDSTVLLDIARKMYPDIPAVFSDTGLEFPEIRHFAMSQDNVIVVRPKMKFPEIIRKYGYPIISKEVAELIYYTRKIGEGRSLGQNEIGSACKYADDFIDTSSNKYKRTLISGRLSGRGVNEGKKSQFNKEKWLPIARDMPFPVSHFCCNVMKKLPMKQFSHKNKLYPITGTQASESEMRRRVWLREGCNAYDSSNPNSKPLSFWTDQDILEYIETYHLPICSVYGEIIQDGTQISLNQEEKPIRKCTGCQRTGCVFCAFGAHLDKERFTRLKETHPRLYRYCIGGGQWADNPNYDPDAPEYDGEWKNWNPQKIWVPSLDGLGMEKVFDMLNEEYSKNGKEFIKYK